MGSLEAFEAIKRAVTEAPMVKFDSQFELYADARAISYAVIRSLVLSSREQLIEEQRRDPEWGLLIIDIWKIPKDKIQLMRRFLRISPKILKLLTDCYFMLNICQLLKKFEIISPNRQLDVLCEFHDNPVWGHLDGAELACGSTETWFEKARQRTKFQQRKWGKYYNIRRSEANVKAKDQALVIIHLMSSASRKVVRKLQSKFEGPHEVIHVEKNNVVIWKEGKPLTVNVDQNKRKKQSSLTSSPPSRELERQELARSVKRPSEKVNWKKRVSQSSLQDGRNVKRPPQEKDLEEDSNTFTTIQTAYYNKSLCFFSFQNYHLFFVEFIFEFDIWSRNYVAAGISLALQWILINGSEGYLFSPLTGPRMSPVVFQRFRLYRYRSK
ncbi:uncharacterized protein TNCV_812501 [Trichonephila clavipes]|nr:uncharacterized protein TNCV_812501 [Trichonephila clavipes]